MPAGAAADVERVDLIDRALAALHTASRRLADCRIATVVVPMCEAVHLSIDQRVARGDTLVAYDVIVEASESLGTVLDRLGMVLVDDADAMARLRELAIEKPRHGCQPVIHGGREAGDIVTQETAATDRGGKERRTDAACGGACPRATAGNRAGRKSC